MKKIVNFIKTHKKYLVIAAIVLGIAGFFGRKIFARQSNKPTYQTAAAERGTLISAITASGTVSAGSNNDISTKASGIVKEVFVKNGETVKKGRKIATLTLDDEAQSRATIAYAAYIDAVNKEKTAEADKLNTDVTMWKARQTLFDAIDDVDYKNDNTTNPDTKKDYTDSEKMIIDKTVDYARKSFEAAETAYTNSGALVSKAKAQVMTAWRAYQEASSTIVSPVDGIISNFSLAPGVTVVASADTSASAASGSVSAQKLGAVVNPDSQYQVSVTLSEIDVTKVNPDMKVTLTFDAYPEMTFTGKVLSIDTSGKVSSGVTNYPATILVDPTTVKLYPNMAATAQIMTNVEDNVILVPSSAIQTAGGETTIRLMKDGKVSSVNVEVGNSNDTQTIVTSGISEGDEVVTSASTSTNTTNRSSGQSGSIFGGMGGNRSFNGSGGAGGAVRIMTR